MIRFSRTRISAGLALAAALAAPGRPDEGMWLFNSPPVKILRERYGFEPPREWLEHLQRASVRFNSGGSGSFVSPDGLVLTNHHVAADCIQKLSTKEKDYLTLGFHARSRSQELACKDEELNVLVSIEDVTERVNAAVSPGMDPAAAQQARRAAMNTIEKESRDQTGLRSNVVTLYQGGQYHLYRFRRYTDVRLVFAPEKAIAFFGGDPDNFEFPRYCLDAAFFRVYENGRPAKIEHYLKWNEGGVKEGDLIFVSGHPGRTSRLFTVAHLEFLRDRTEPLSLNVVRRREVLLRTYSERDAENARRAQDELMAYQNSRKARLGMLAGLQDPALMARKRADEQALRDAVARDPKLRREYGDAWDQVAAAIRAWREIYDQHYLLERGAAFRSTLFQIARDLVRLAEETAKPNAERLPEYSEARLDSLQLQLFSGAPIYEDLETLQLADSLALWMEMAGGDDPLLRQALGGKSPRERAAELVAGTGLKEVAARKQLAAGGRSAIEASRDPMIALALLVDPEARRARKVYEEKVEEPLRQAYAKIANARFALFGPGGYPDATFTLRLAFGRVQGYSEQNERIPWATVIGGAYRRAQAQGHREPFALPRSWRERKGRLNLETPFNFVSTADITGGNSGSPVVNRDGQLVGLIFDGNIHSLALDYLYSEEKARAIAVHSAAILEALRKIYDARELVAELTGKQSGPRARTEP